MAEYWLENIQRVFDEMACSSDDYLTCVMSLLKNEAYNWWSRLTAVVSKDRINGIFLDLSSERSMLVNDT